LGTIPADRAPSAVFHLAGRHDDAPLHAHTAAQVHDVFAGKVGGARTLAAWVPDAVPLVFFSSVSGLLGAPGQAAYAAANAALDAVAAERRQRGGHALSLAWGPWSEAGMFASLPDGLRARLAHRLPPHGLREGFAALDRALAHPGALLAAFSPPPSTVRRPLREQLYTTLERLLGRPAPPDRDVRELGLDSLGVLELHRSLGEALGASVDLRTLDDWRPDAILAALETPPPVVAVAAQCLPLCAEDDMPHNTASVVFTSRPVDAAAFRRALGTALQRFPHLAGRLQGDASARTFFVGPGPGDVPLDVVRDDAPLDVHGFSALSAAELEARFVPGFPAGTIDALNEDRPLAALQLTQLPGAAVLGVCVSHLLLDATGAWLFYETLRCALAGQDLPDITRDRGVVPGVGPWQPTTVSPPPWYRALSHEACADVDVAERRRAADDPLVTFTLAREAVPEGTDPWRAVAGTLWAWAVEAAQLPQSELAIWHDIRGRSGSPVPFHYTGNCGCYWHVSDADLPDRGAASRAAALATLSGEAHDRRLLDVCNALATARFLGRPHRWCGDAPHVVALNLIPQLALGPGTALRILGRNVPGFRVYEGTGGNAFHVEAVFPEAVQRRLLAILGTEAGVSAIVRHGRGWRGTGPDWAG
jgi:acyl carrier protein